MKPGRGPQELPMRKTVPWLMALCLTAAALPARAQTNEDRATARDLITKKGDAVVLVLATLKTRMSINGRENARDSPVQANATMLDSSGLAVMALSVLEPSEAMIRGMAAPGQQLDLKTETTELRMRLADGREIGARIVLRDTDLDLAFLRPLEPLPAPIPAVDAAMAKPQVMDLVIAVQRTGEPTGYRAMGTFGYVQMTVDKPRLYYITSTGQLGAPVFDSAGRFVGVTVRVAGARANPQPGVLPADDIRDIAKQAK